MKQLLFILPVWACLPALAQNSDSSRYYYETGLKEQSAKRYMVAAQAFDKSIKFNPANEEALLANAFVNLEMKKLDAAKNYFTRVYELNPKNLKAINQLMELTYSYRQFAKATELAQQCKECENSLRIIGMSAYQQEDYPAAEKSLKAAVAKHPEDAEAIYTLARTYLDMEEYNKAIPWFEKAIKQPNAKNTWMYELGLLYYNQSDYKNASNAFNMAADNGYVQSLDFKENMGFASLYSGDYEKGEKLLLDIYAKKPGNKDLLRDMASAFYAQRQYDKSLDYCQKLLEIDDKDGKALYQAGLAFQKKGEKDRGQKMCDKAIDIDPSLASLRTKKEIPGL
ncbi:MAG: tetratricopeptide repeat protein [Bacteroidetes bacterium]|nr:tetratricopeptide repeat protein [Bacteroidota bacterium]